MAAIRAWIQLQIFKFTSMSSLFALSSASRKVLDGINPTFDESFRRVCVENTYLFWSRLAINCIKISVKMNLFQQDTPRIQPALMTDQKISYSGCQFELPVGKRNLAIPLHSFLSQNYPFVAILEPSSILLFSAAILSRSITLFGISETALVNTESNDNVIAESCSARWTRIIFFKSFAKAERQRGPV